MSIKKCRTAKYGINYCSYCEDRKTEAKWHNFWKRITPFACDEHKENLRDAPEGEKSEGDYQLERFYNI